MADVRSGDGTRIHYEVDGDGPPVVLLHGMTGTYETNWVAPGWKKVLLEAGFQAIGIDGRGRGGSEVGDDPLFYRNGPCVADITAVLDDLGVEKAHLVGYSMGSGHALRMALAAPARARSVVLGGTGGGALAFAGLYTESAMHSREKLGRWFEMLLKLLEMRAGDGRDRSYIQAYAEALQQDALESGNLEEVALPVLIVVGDGDNVQGTFGAMAITEMLARRLPNARRLVVEGRDHMTCLPSRRFKEATIEFLRAQDQA